MQRIIGFFMVVALAMPAHAVERYKPLPTEKDNAQMDSRLMNGELFKFEDFLAHPEQYHWTGFYNAAAELFHQGRKDEAVMWYYAGQIRARVAAGLDPDPSRNGALLSSLNYGLGGPINVYAGSDRDNWLKQIDAAITWDVAHPLAPNPKDVIGIEDVAFDKQNFELVYAQIRQGLAAMREQIAAMDPAELARERRSNGLSD